MIYSFLPFEQPSVATSNGTQFPARRNFCVGRNYLAHVLELNGNPENPPFFFAKPNETIVPDGTTIPFAVATESLHFESELVVAIGQGGSGIPAATALDTSGVMPPKLI